MSWDEEAIEPGWELDMPDWEFDPEGCTEDDEWSVLDDPADENGRGGSTTKCETWFARPGDSSAKIDPSL